MCEKGEGDAASGEDLLSGAPEEHRGLSHAASSIRSAKFTSGAPDFATLLLFFHFFRLSLPTTFSAVSFYLGAKEARTTRLLEKSARLPRALINLHSARGGRKGGTGDPSLPVLLGLMLPIECGAVNLVNGRNARRGANGAFSSEGSPFPRKSLASITFRKSGLPINDGRKNALGNENDSAILLMFLYF